MRTETTRASIHIAVQSERRLVRDVIAAYFAERPDFAVVGRVSGCADLVTLCELRHPEAIIFDVGPSLTEIIETYRALRARFPYLRAVVLYDQASSEELNASARTGGLAMLPHSRGLDTLVTLLRHSVVPEPPPDGYSAIDDHELTILALMCSGHSVHEMAALLDTSPGAVEHHKRRIYTKLEARSSAHAVSLATSLGIVTGVLPGAPPRGDPAPSATSACPGTEPAGPVLVVVRGTEGPTLDRVVLLLVAHQLPFVLDAPSGPADCPAQRRDQADIVLSHRGPVAVVLVDPAPSDWELPSVLGGATILVCSEPPGDAATALAVGQGAQAMLSADRLSDHLAPVLELVGGGYYVVEVARVQPFAAAVGQGQDRLSYGLPRLTGRETDLLQSIGAGHTVRQTARTLGISVKTVEATQTRLFQKLGVHNRSSALLVASGLGLL